MARRSRSGRVAHRNANSVAPSINDFDEKWLRDIQERAYARFVDLTSIEDRRRWHPSNRTIGGPAPRGLAATRPRIVIVPEGHPLARLAPYGGRVPLHKVLKRENRIRRRFLDDWSEKQRFDKHGGLYSSYMPDHLSRRVGFQHPWQVMICIRRKQRKEVLHAFKKTGSGGGKQRRPRRNFWSEVRC